MHLICLLNFSPIIKRSVVLAVVLLTFVCFMPLTAHAEGTKEEIVGDLYTFRTVSMYCKELRQARKRTAPVLMAAV